MANGYYRVGQYYFDTAGKALYRCTGAGDKTSSTWAQVAGGGGSAAQYTFVSDAGDYIVATSNAVTLGNAGSGYQATDVLTLTGGAGTAMQITVDTVSSGAIATFHVSTQPAYTVYPSNPASVTGGHGSGATFNFPLVNIAKFPELWCSLSGETYIDGTGAHTYTYTAVTVSGVIVAYTRTNHWSSTSATESITPSYLVGGKIYAVTIPAINLPVSPGSGSTVAVSLMDLHARYWGLQ